MSSLELVPHSVPKTDVFLRPIRVELPCRLPASQSSRPQSGSGSPGLFPVSVADLVTPGRDSASNNGGVHGRSAERRTRHQQILQLLSSQVRGCRPGTFWDLNGSLKSFWLGKAETGAAVLDVHRSLQTPAHLKHSAGTGTSAGTTRLRGLLRRISSAWSPQEGLLRRGSSEGSPQRGLLLVISSFPP